MNLKSFVDIEIVKGERTYHFLMPVGAPFGEAYDASFETLSAITDMAKQAAEQAKPKEGAEEVAEATSNE